MSLKRFPSLLFTVTSTALPWDFYFFKLTQLLTVSVKEKGGNLTENHTPFWFKKSIQKPQDYARKPQWNCTFMNSTSGECTEHHRQDFLHIAHTETQVDWKQSTSIQLMTQKLHTCTCANYTGFISMLATWGKRVHIKLNEKGVLPKTDENGHRIKNKYNSIKCLSVSALLLTKPNILPMIACFASILNEVSFVKRQSTWKKLNLEKKLHRKIF